MNNKYVIDSNYEVIPIENENEYTSENTHKTFVNMLIKFNDTYFELLSYLITYISYSSLNNIEYLTKYAIKHNYNILNQTINIPIHSKLCKLFKWVVPNLYTSPDIQLIAIRNIVSTTKEIDLNREIEAKQRKYKSTGTCDVCIQNDVLLIPYNWCGHELCIDCYKIIKTEDKPCPFCRYD